MGTSCLVLGESTATDNIVTGPGKASIRPQRRNSATPSAAASYNDDAVTTGRLGDALGVCEGHPAGACHDSSIGEHKAKNKIG
jgi:hypothetical protein